jgi:6-bladed beta-propeller
MQVRAGVMTAVAVALGLGVSVSTQQRVPTLMSAFDYDVVPNWSLPYPTKGYAWGSVPGIFVESDDRIFIASRGEIKEPSPLPADYPGFLGGFKQVLNAPDNEVRGCLRIVDSNGKVLEIWTQWDKLFQGTNGPHKIKISPYDPEKHVWVVDDLRQQVFEFTNDGKQLVLTLGEPGVAGNDQNHFGRPTDLAFLPDGTFFVTDGYVNTRVVKFDKNGKFLMTWGTPGKGPGQFNLPHSIDIDRNRRVYVADRSNSRIQIFDENGKFLDQWPDIQSPYHIVITADQHLWVSDGETNKFIKYDMNGKYLYSWGTYGFFAGEFFGVHQFSIDQSGNLYAAETFGKRTQKFVPKKGADPGLVIAPPQRASASTQ